MELDILCGSLQMKYMCIDLTLNPSPAGRGTFENEGFCTPSPPGEGAGG